MISGGVTVREGAMGFLGKDSLRAPHLHSSVRVLCCRTVLRPRNRNRDQSPPRASRGRSR